jgi:Glycosyl transferases group 1
MADLVVLSLRNIDHSPAMCCLVELENVILKDFAGELYCLPSVPDVRGTTVLCTLMNFHQLKSVEPALARIKQAGNRVILYVFDCWDVCSLYGKRRLLHDLAKPWLRIDRIVDRLCLPFGEALDVLKPEHRAISRHVPLAVDTSLVNGLNKLRPISVLGYGRQPPELSRALAESMNDPSSPFIYHHTDHLSIEQINDQRLHRMHFWKLAQSSQIALTYDAKVTSPWRTPFSVVGQRFYESLAAGCVLAGKRPTTKEADELLDWPEAIIDLPDGASDAVDALRDLHSDPRRIARIRERNVEEVQARHDWRHRIPMMFAD